jgi:hypothetical protein
MAGRGTAAEQSIEKAARLIRISHRKIEKGCLFLA